MLYVVYALDKKDILPVRAKHYRAHRVHLDNAGDYAVDVVTAGTLVADDGETPVGSVFVIDAQDRATVDAFTGSDPYHVNGVLERRRHSPLQQETRHPDRRQALTSCPAIAGRIIKRALSRAAPSAPSVRSPRRQNTAARRNN